MKHIDFTQPGGFPLTQDALNYLQQAHIDILNELAQTLAQGTTAPVILTGCTSGPFLGEFRMRSGWIYYNGEIYFTNGGLLPFGPYSGTQTTGFTVTTNTTSLTYNDTNIHPSLQEKVLTFGIVADSVSDATHFPVSALQPWLKDATAGSVPIGGQNGETGSMFYRKNWLNNTLQIYGTMNLTNAQNIVPTVRTIGTGYYEVCILPIAPASVTPFTLYYRYQTTPILDDTGRDYITQVNAEVGTDGFVAVGWRRPAAGVTAYTVYFNTIIPLD